MTSAYVQGYDAAEGNRLHDQARMLETLLHAGTEFPEGSTVRGRLSCRSADRAVGPRQPGRAVHLRGPVRRAHRAELRVRAAGLPLPTFGQADIRALPFADGSFDYAFVCFVLEHLPAPELALDELRRVLRPGGSLTVIEGDHGSTLFHPDDPAARTAIQCQVELQRQSGGDANIGRRLYPMPVGAGLRSVAVSPRLVYVYASRPALVDGFIRDTFTAMVAGVRAEAIRAGLADAAGFDAGIKALLRTAEPDGVFCYTFFKQLGFASGQTDSVCFTAPFTPEQMGGDRPF